jgi:hypothetical protein
MSDVKYIEYAHNEKKVYEKTPMGDVKERIVRMPGHTPQTPPYTTWNGVLEVPKESVIGKYLQKMDSDCKAPQMEDPKDKTQMITVPGKEHLIRGKWIAPQDWSVISRELQEERSMDHQEERAALRKRRSDAHEENYKYKYGLTNATSEFMKFFEKNENMLKKLENKSSKDKYDAIQKHMMVGV